MAAGACVLARVPIIAVIRLVDPIVRAELLVADAGIVLVKPCNPHDLRACVATASPTRHIYAEILGRR